MSQSRDDGQQADEHTILDSGLKTDVGFIGIQATAKAKHRQEVSGETISQEKRLLRK